MDLADVGGNVRDGCHIASMGGTWMVSPTDSAGCATMTAYYRSGRSDHQKPDHRFDSH
jgi:hypothetical protein